MFQILILILICCVKTSAYIFECDIITDPKICTSINGLWDQNEFSCMWCNDTSKCLSYYCNETDLVVNQCPTEYIIGTCGFGEMSKKEYTTAFMIVTWIVNFWCVVFAYSYMKDRGLNSGLSIVLSILPSIFLFLSQYEDNNNIMRELLVSISPGVIAIFYGMVKWIDRNCNFFPEENIQTRNVYDRMWDA